MQFIDSHAHLNAPEFKNDWENIVATAKDIGIITIINVGGDLADSEWGSQQAQDEPIVYATVGIHPESLAGQLNDLSAKLNNLRRIIFSNPKIIGIGEIGLDYTLDSTQAPKQLQADLLKSQIELALEFKLPIVLHVRDQKGSTDCFDDVASMLNQFTTSRDATLSVVGSQSPVTPSADNRQLTTDKQLHGVFHCWTGTPDQVQTALNLGFYISFSGILTYKSAGHILDAAHIVPNDRLLIETDSPFLTPEPARSQQHPSTNEPKYVILTAEKLAQVRNITLDHIAHITTTNAQRLFKLPKN